MLFDCYCFPVGADGFSCCGLMLIDFGGFGVVWGLVLVLCFSLFICVLRIGSGCGSTCSWVWCMPKLLPLCFEV